MFSCIAFGKIATRGTCSKTVSQVGQDPFTRLPLTQKIVADAFCWRTTTIAEKWSGLQWCRLQSQSHPYCLTCCPFSNKNMVVFHSVPVQQPLMEEASQLRSMPFLAMSSSWIFHTEALLWKTHYWNCSSILLFTWNICFSEKELVICLDKGNIRIRRGSEKTCYKYILIPRKLTAFFCKVPVYQYK